MRVGRSSVSIVLIVALTACVGGATATPIPTHSPSPVASDNPTPSRALPVPHLVQVLAEVLAVRAAPSVSAEQVGVLDYGAAVSLLEGPVAADGYAWYRVRHGDLTGWAAVGDGVDQWIVDLGPTTGAWTLRVDRYPDVVGPQGTAAFVLLADGWLVRPVETGWEQRLLTSEGVQLFIEAATDSGLLETNAQYVTPRPGYQAGYTTWSIRLSQTARGVFTVTAINASDAPEAALVMALADELVALADRLPAGWLVDADLQPEPYEIWAYNLIVSPSVAGALADFPPERLLGDADVDTVELPLTASVLEIGEELPFAGVRCASLTGEEARALRQAFYTLGLDRAGFDAVTVEVSLRWAAQNGVVWLNLNAVPPGDDPSCVRYGGTG